MGTAVRAAGGAAPATLAQVRVRSCKRTGKGKKTSVRCSLRSFGAVSRATVRVTRNGKTVKRGTVRPKSGVLTLKIKRKLKKGRYAVKITLRNAAGQTRALKAVKFRIKK